MVGLSIRRILIPPPLRKRGLIQKYGKKLSNKRIEKIIGNKPSLQEIMVSHTT
jgi:hypothetical protein